MVGRILELTRPGLSVHKRRGFLAVDTSEGEAGRIAFDDVAAVLVASPGISWSNTALAELAARQVPVMVLGHDFNPVAVMLPLNGHFQQAHRIRAQADVSLPFRKQAWATLVRHKITAQAAALDRVNKPSERLRRLATAVRSGDLGNCEAQAAQAYWPLMMDKAFRRDRNTSGANALLNYGYAVLRAATARATVAAGLHPSLSVHHRSGGDALALADDLMEPFRPTVDMIVRRLCAKGITDVAEARGALVACLAADFPTSQGASPLSQVLLRLAQSLAQSCETGKLRLAFPDRPIPIASGIHDDE